MELTIDFETRSTIDLKKCGMYVYWQSPYTEVMMLSVKVDDEPTLVWIPEKFRHLKDTEVSDEELERLTSSAEHIVAHNAGFERQGFKYGMTKLGFSDIPLEKIRCTQAQSLACALPRDLDSVAKIVTGGKYLKDKEGHNLMLKMSKPRALVKAECLEISKTDWKEVKKLQAEFLERMALGRFTEQDKERVDQFLKYKEDKEDFERLVEYARQDVEVERKIYKQLPKLSPYEQKVWVLDQQINDRGVFVDRKNCEKIKNTVDVYTKKLSKKALEITGNRVTSVKSPKSILSWLRDNGLDFTSVDKESVEFLLSLEIPSHVREFLEIKQKVGKSSVAKYDALLNYSLGDGRFRGGMSYHVATTGRWGGNGPQPQNFPRPSENNFVKCSDKDTRKEVFADEKDIRLLTSQDFDLIEYFWKDSMVLAADLIRPMLIAPEGKDFICADFSAVEGRGLAWLAGQEDKLQAYREGKDLYKVAASGVYKIPYEEVDGGGKGVQRQVGKTCELALGFGGSVGAMMRFNADKLGLTEPEMKNIVKAWRKTNDKIVEFWYELRDASLDAMRFPGDRIKAGKVSFRKRGNFLTLRLPSGRDLFYPQAKVEETEFSYENDEGELITKKQKLVTAMTLTSAKQWVRRPLSHVTLSENATQATCRDLLVNGMFNVERAGYPIVLHVHDEILSEVDEGKGNLKEFEELMAKLPEWAEGLPLKADGWIGKFYQK